MRMRSVVAAGGLALAAGSILACSNSSTDDLRAELTSELRQAQMPPDEVDCIVDGLFSTYGADTLRSEIDAAEPSPAFVATVEQIAVDCIASAPAPG